MEINVISLHREGRGVPRVLLTFQRDSSQILERDVPGYELSKSLGKDL
jgi:hypothetical protein